MISRAGSPIERSPNIARKAALPYTTMWPGPWAMPAGRVSGPVQRSVVSVVVTVPSSSRRQGAAGSDASIRTRRDG